LHELFGTERMKGINSCRAARGQVAGKQRHGKQQHSRCDERDRVGWLHVEEDALEIASDAECRSRAEGKAEHRNYEASTEHETKNIAAARSESHADANFARACADVVGEQSE